MVDFDLWKESFIFAVIYSFLIIIPCILAVWIGRNMIERLGQWPSKTPVIQMGAFFKLVLLEAVTFTSLIGFYLFFTSKK